MCCKKWRFLNNGYIYLPFAYLYGFKRRRIYENGNLMFIMVVVDSGQAFAHALPRLGRGGLFSFS
ncbi:hypothetical protein ACVW2L_003140 [Mucilaginibacter sp. HD30]